MNTPSPIRAAIAAERYETARRIGLQYMSRPETRTTATILDLHDAHICQADFQAARKLLEDNVSAFAHDPFTLALKLAEDFHTLAIEGHYRLSEEGKQGYSIDEYMAKYRGLAKSKYEEASRLAATEEQKAALEGSQVSRRLIAATSPAAASSVSISESTAPSVPSNGTLTASLVWPDGSPVAGATVTLGLKMPVNKADPATFTTYHMHYLPDIGEQEKMTATTDAKGGFTIKNIPAGTHDFLAVTLDPARYEIVTRFLLRDIAITEGGIANLGNITVTEWQSAPGIGFKEVEARAVAAEAALADEEAAASSNNSPWKTVSRLPLRNPFHFNFPRQLLRLPVPAGINLSDTEVRVVTTADDLGATAVIQPSQLVLPEQHNSTGFPTVAPDDIAFMATLPPKAELSIAIQTRPRQASLAQASTVSGAMLTTSELNNGKTLQIDTGTASFKFAWNNSAAAPIQNVRGADGVWRGEGRFVLPEGVSITGSTTTMRQRGAVLAELVFTYELSNGAAYKLAVTVLAGEPCLFVRETSAEIEGASFEFSLRELSGGRGYLHWTPEHGGFHWSSLKAQDETIAMLPESVPWWIPPQGFGYAMTPEGLESKDYIAVFSLRRGTWIDRKFERIAQGPINADGTENRELDWPYPEMVGSSISVITAHTSAQGDAYFRFGMFDGERSWGLLVSTLEQNDGPWKQIAFVQHSNSSPRLQEFKDWHLDEADSHARPNTVLKRKQLFALREKTRSPRLKRIWQKISDQEVRGPVEGLSFAVEGNPLVAWRKRTELAAVAPIRSKMILLGRDWCDMYSPVGGRSITQWAEDYDMLAASGVFTVEEERELRAFFILAGHMFMEEDFMNWRFNARNANFEADRTDIIGTIGIVFDGHPDAVKFVDHTIERTHKALGVYCTPGSGKWYENPACYYLHAAKCRMNLVYHLARHGRLNVAEIPRLKEFLQWAVVLLTPPQPVSYEAMRAGNEEWYLKSEKTRKVPPIGDHAAIGRWLPEHYFFIGKLFQQTDPDFARHLTDAYFCSNADGLRLIYNDDNVIEQVGEHPFHEASAGAAFGNLCLLFTSIEETDIPQSAQATLASRRLEGFGAVLRSHVNTPQENYILIKQGPGGYRYHRTEGSFLLFAEGKPLVYDGGEAGETWRHSTLSFFDTHMPLSAGHVERIFLPEQTEGSHAQVHPAYQFVQGVHPEIIRPGQPVFLSDLCRHELVEESYRRFAKPNPVVVRSYTWVGDSYMVVHDALDLPEADAATPVHWHLQAVADEDAASEKNGAEPAALARSSNGQAYRFKGRFGTDIVVSLPGQTFQSEEISQLSILEYHSTPDQCFGMRHLQLSQPGMKAALAILKPVAAGKSSDLSTEAVYSQDANATSGKPTVIGAKVKLSSETGADDHLFFAHKGTEWSDADVSFSGKYGAVLRRMPADTLVLTGTGTLSLGNDRQSGFSVRSIAPEGDPGALGPNVMLTRTWDSATLRATGAGKVKAIVFGKTLEADVNGESSWIITSDQPRRGAEIFLHDALGSDQRLARVALSLASPEEVDKLHRQMKDQQASFVAAPEQSATGAYEFTARDGQGNTYRIYHAGKNL